ncbi:OLC1v1031199C1 [Oldenlandia corymbosa var. corymbosa]|uniref:OLC1v1031199C1 n=1 Tax=Oldenlandia corymbosa var. corymbosa TaxID=529605 RepID=A0AAV1CIL5_OLDCO|nr:OLC1v1031199C1 [Oldenlandia corymbosa var. corymbosa]
MTKRKADKGGKSTHRGASTHGREKNLLQDTSEISLRKINDIPRSRSQMDKNHCQSPEGMVRERDFVSHDARETNDVVHIADDNSQSQIQDGRSEIKVYKGKECVFSVLVPEKHLKKFLEKIDVGGFTWSKVSQPTKDFYFDEFKEAREGRPPTAHELFLHTHTEKHDRMTFVDSKSKKTNANPKFAQGDQSIDKDGIFLEAAGGKKKGRVYGLGCQSSTYFPSPIDKISATQNSETESRYKKSILVMSEELRAVKKQLRAERTSWKNKFNGLCEHLGFSTEILQPKGKKSVEVENYTLDSSNDDSDGESQSQKGSMDYGDEEDSESDSGSMDSGNEDGSESDGDSMDGNHLSD